MPCTLSATAVVSSGALNLLTDRQMNRFQVAKVAGKTSTWLCPADSGALRLALRRCLLYAPAMLLRPLPCTLSGCAVPGAAATSAAASGGCSGRAGVAPAGVAVAVRARPVNACAAGAAGGDVCAAPGKLRQKVFASWIAHDEQSV